MKKTNICVAIVTFNRLDKLKKALTSYESQTFLPSMIIVLDNNSTDGTTDYLKNWEKEDSKYEKKVIYNDKNIGGSGGFSKVISSSLEYDYEWLFLSDDDAYPENDCFDKVIKYSKELSKDEMVICSSVYENGEINFYHRRKIVNNFFNLSFINCAKNDYENEKFYLDVFSFVGIAINKNAIKELGIPEAKFFIWQDDAEYSLRFRDKYKIVCYPSIKVIHEAEFVPYKINWKIYYGERNFLYMAKKHFSKVQYFMYKIKYFLRELKNFFLNKKKYLILKEAKKDFKNNNYGISTKYYPGCKM